MKKNGIMLKSNMFSIDSRSFRAKRNLKDPAEEEVPKQYDCEGVLCLWGEEPLFD